MSLQPMPVLDRLLKKRHTLSRDVVEQVDIAWGAVKVRADVAADMYWQTPKEHWHRERDYPPVRLPFPAMWFEWDQPKQWLSDNKRAVSAAPAVPMRNVFDGSTENFEIGGIKMAALTQEFEIPDSRRAQFHIPGFPPAVVNFDSRAEHAFTVTIHALREGMAIMIPFTGLVQVDRQGMQLREVQWCGPGTPEDARMTVELLGSITPPALLAIGLMNCKNVTTREIQSQVPIGRKQRRRNLGVTYRTILVPGHEERADRTARRDSSEMEHSLHRVRGHFKTFTAEAPLLGQHVGTYWWGWQVRGNKKNGAVVSDYKIGAAS